MKKFKFQRGFTLIELLVVIAIIGVLSSVVLASLNSARQKGQIAAIKANLNNMIAQAELSYDATGNYSTACISIQPMIDAIANSGGIASCYSHPANGYIRWAAAAQLNSDTSINFAVDTSGVVIWDTSDKTPTHWANANVLCSASSSRLATPEQFKALYQIYGGIPTGFQSGFYWGNMIDPNNSANAGSFLMSSGSVTVRNKGQTDNVRCVH